MDNDIKNYQDFINLSREEKIDFILNQKESLLRNSIDKKIDNKKMVDYKNLESFLDRFKKVIFLALLTFLFRGIMAQGELQLLIPMNVILSGGVLLYLILYFSLFKKFLGTNDRVLFPVIASLIFLAHSLVFNSEKMDQHQYELILFIGIVLLLTYTLMTLYNWGSFYQEKSSIYHKKRKLQNIEKWKKSLSLLDKKDPLLIDEWLDVEGKLYELCDKNDDNDSLKEEFYPLFLENPLYFEGRIIRSKLSQKRRQRMLILIVSLVLLIVVILQIC
jgi:hypothetical protein